MYTNHVLPINNRTYQAQVHDNYDNPNFHLIGSFLLKFYNLYLNFYINQIINHIIRVALYDFWEAT